MRDSPVPTPTSPLAHPFCDGFVILVNSQGGCDLNILREKVVGRLGSEWELITLDGESELEIVPTREKRLSVSLGWEISRDLKEFPGVIDAEPVLTTPGIEPSSSYALKSSEAGLLAKGNHKGCSVLPDWSGDLVNVRAAWGLEPGLNGSRLGEGIVVGHPDTGYTDHPEMNGSFLVDKGHDFESGDNDARDSLKGSHLGHGTATASVIASPLVEPSNIVSGIAPKAKIVPLRVSTSVVHLNFRKVAKSIRYAADQGCHVISMSLGGPFGPKYLRRAVDYAIGKGVIVLAAAGNVWPFVVFPARFPQVIGVAACNCRSQIWNGSATGADVDMTAPGESVWRARTAGDGSFSTERSSGTSYAVATTAGACALWLAFHGRKALTSRYGKENLARLFQHLLTTKGVNTLPNWDTKNVGSGILNVEKLLRADLPIDLSKIPTPKLVSAAAKLSGYFPGLPASRVKSGIQQILGISEGELKTLQEEIEFHIATNPHFREQIARASKAKEKIFSKKVSGKQLMKTNPLLLKNASSLLKKLMTR